MLYLHIVHGLFSSIDTNLLIIGEEVPMLFLYAYNRIKAHLDRLAKGSISIVS